MTGKREQGALVTTKSISHCIYTPFVVRQIVVEYIHESGYILQLSANYLGSPYAYSFQKPFHDLVITFRRRLAAFL